ncbi:hypothetical protein T492DRAFT_862669 [Pavlovales sp. CCMP2436]|nr:hypothetical protein T492DRAFT_862669 [Pavlovales sp. CCMP2436]
MQRSALQPDAVLPPHSASVPEPLRSARRSSPHSARRNSPARALSLSPSQPLSALAAAARLGDFILVSSLLEEAVSAALWQASCGGFAPIVELLLSRGATDPAGKCLSAAKAAGHDAVVFLLLADAPPITPQQGGNFNLPSRRSSLIEPAAAAALGVAAAETVGAAAGAPSRFDPGLQSRRGSFALGLPAPSQVPANGTRGGSSTPPRRSIEVNLATKAAASPRRARGSATGSATVRQIVRTSNPGGARTLPRILAETDAPMNVTHSPAGAKGGAKVSADTHSLVKEIAAQGGRKMYALMGVSPMEAAARIKKQLIDTIGTIAARGHAQLLLARLSALAPIAAQRGNTTNSNQQIISLNALAQAHYRRSIGTRGGAQASAAD